MIVGHKEIIKKLDDMICDNTIPHGLLFEGLEKLGKEKVLMWFSKKILCNTHKNKCDCTSCIQFDTGNHPDIHIINPEGNKINKEHFNDEFKYFYTHPYHGDKKIFIIIEAHRMNETVQNKLLKRLEEPPEGTYIFLHSSKGDKLLETVLSRVRRIKFSNVKYDEIEEFLIDKYKASPNEAKKISQLSSGLPGFAIDCMANSEYLELESKWNEYLKMFLEEPNFYFQIRSFIMKNKSDIPFLIDKLKWYIRDIKLRELGASSKLMYPKMLPNIKIETIGMESLSDYLEEVEKMLAVNVNMDLIVDNLLIRLQEVRT